jgi:hypothetical protein
LIQGNRSEKEIYEHVRYILSQKAEEIRTDTVLPSELNVYARKLLESILWASMKEQ